MADIEDWKVKGELSLNCNCDVFCPCVVSLGEAKPSQGYCQAWMAVRIDEGKWGETSLSGQNVAAVLDIPGRMSEGGWSVGLYVDESATDAQAAALEKIFSGAARGTTGLFRLLVSNFLGTQRVPISYESDGKVRSISAGRKIVAAIKPIDGADTDKPVTVHNTGYWMGPDVTIAQGLKSKVRDFGRVWNFDNKSAEICQIDWSGP
jgi:hypothetical protein